MLFQLQYQLRNIHQNYLIHLEKFFFHERKISPDELGNFDGCFLTGTAAEITPVASIADHKYKICDVILGLSKSFDQLVRQKKAA